MISRIFRGEIENVAVKRKRQIDTLKIFNDNVTELRENVDYRVEFQAGERRMAIVVSLSPNFPLEKPVLRVSPPISHPWCNEHSEITSAPGLLNFSVHSDLGRVVQAIIREFSKNPPQLLDDTSPGSTKPHRDLQGRNSPSYSLQQYPIEIPSTSFSHTYVSTSKSFGSTSHHSTYIPNSRNNTLQNSTSTRYTSDQHSAPYLNSHYANANYQQSLPSQSQTKAPQSIIFPELNSLTNEELKRLSEDNDKLDDFLEKYSQIKDINAAIEDAMDWVEKTAEANAAKEPELEQLQVDVADKVKTVAALKARYDHLIQRYNKLSEVFTPDHIKECLRQAADESHEESEKIAEDFLNRKIDVERFLSTYIECRKLGQARRTKEEKLAHQLNELKRAGF
ncbi:vacuolar protein sorting-associated protein 37A isoform X2 [Pogonomyrmex barbatus]|uniref:Vacuolar protein sorting-associated protein 37A isoform X2 n=1 Tax=Pogonomyrmex barbatus TaxID=144034 RepID=A0A6I9XHV1_9HYME|nr:vacuolar protein sorting-associated protein 37A isoform X2 [Pogonomyrmex barbatus]